MKLVRRVGLLLVLLIVAVYGTALAYLRWTEPSQAFIGADLTGTETLTVSGVASVPWDTIRVTTADGVRVLLLESRLADSPDAPWVIYFYGRAGRLADQKGFAMFRLFRDVGLHTLSVDYRGYGASEKIQPTEAGLTADARAAWRYLRETRGVSTSRVILYGYSLGGAVAIQLASEILPAGLVTEGAFSSGPRWVQSHYPLVPAALARLLMRNRFENLEKADALPVPWLLFHGRRDAITPFSHSEALAGTAAGMRRLVSLDCGHEDAIDLERERMKEALAGFLSEAFAPRSGTGTAAQNRDMTDSLR